MGLDATRRTHTCVERTLRRRVRHTPGFRRSICQPWLRASPCALDPSPDGRRDEGRPREVALHLREPAPPRVPAHAGRHRGDRTTNDSRRAAEAFADANPLARFRDRAGLHYLRQRQLVQSKRLRTRARIHSSSYCWWGANRYGHVSGESDSTARTAPCYAPATCRYDAVDRRVPQRLRTPDLGANGSCHSRGGTPPIRLAVAA